MTETAKRLDVIMDNVADLDGYYTITVAEDGVYLLVKPPQGRGKAVSDAVVMRDLQARDIAEVERALLLRTLKEAKGEAVKIAPPPAPPAEPEIAIDISRDKMTATMTIVAAKNARPVTLEEVRARVDAVGITHGVDERKIAEALARPGWHVTFAQGTPAENGQDGRVKYTVDMDKAGRPAEREDGTVNFKDLQMFLTVRSGQVLAERVPATAGRDGCDILGHPVAAKPGKEAVIPCGKNVTLQDGGARAVAAIDGQITRINGRLTVLPVIVIAHDVDLSTGNVDFVGSVVVRGSVQPGFTVKAGGNVEVGGTVSGATVIGNNIVVRMGIQGMNKGEIIARDSVTAKFIENATIRAGKDIIVSEAVMHCHVSAGKKVTVNGRRGLIVGGVVSAGEEIHAKVIGSPLATPTVLQAGVNPALREEYAAAKKELQQLEFKLDQTQKALNILRVMERTKLSGDKQEMLLRLTKANFHLLGQTEALRNRIAEIELAVADLRAGRIKVADLLHSGVKLVIGNATKTVRDVVKYATIYAEDGEVKIGAYK